MTKKELLAQKKELLASLRRKQIAKEVTDALSFDLTQIIQNVSKTEKINELSEAILAIEKKIDKLPSRTNALLKKKILEEVRELIAENTPEIDEIVAKIPKPKDGKNGRDGKTPKKGVDYFTAKEVKDFKKEIQASIPKPKDGINGKNGSPDTPKQIKEKIQKIKGDKWFPAKNIKDLDLIIPTVPQNRSGSEGSTGIPDAPKDGKQYGRQDGGWTEVTGGGAVDSVFGRTGDVVAENGDYTTDQVTEATNLYYTDARVSANPVVVANTAKNSWDYNADINPIINVVDPTNPQDAATKNYVDTELSSLTSTATYIDSSNTVSTTYGTLSGSIDGINTTYTVSQGVYNSGSLAVYLNGVLQNQENFSETIPASGTFDFVVAPEAGDDILIAYVIGDSVSVLSNVLLTKAANYTVTGNEAKGEISINVDATSGDIRIDLPTASSYQNRFINVSKIDASTNKVVVDANADLINGSSTKEILFQYTNIRLQSDGSNFYIK